MGFALGHEAHGQGTRPENVSDIAHGRETGSFRSPIFNMSKRFDTPRLTQINSTAFWCPLQSEMGTATLGATGLQCDHHMGTLVLCVCGGGGGCSSAAAALEFFKGEQGHLAEMDVASACTGPNGVLLRAESTCYQAVVDVYCYSVRLRSVWSQLVLLLQKGCGLTSTESTRPRDCQTDTGPIVRSTMFAKNKNVVMTSCSCHQCKLPVSGAQY